MADNRLPSDLHPKQLKSFAQGRRQVAGLASTIADKRSELGRRRVEFESLASRISQLVAQVGIEPRSERPLEQLQRCLKELAEQQTLLAQRDELTAQQAPAQALSADAAPAESLATQASAADALLRYARRSGIPPPRGVQSTAAQLRGELAEVDRAIEAALAGQAAREDITDWLSGGHDLAAIETEWSQSRQTVASRLSAAHEQRGALNGQLAQLADERQLGEKQLELDIVEQRLSEALLRWRVLAVCNLLLEAVRAFYERQRQPQALREASRWLKRLTGGRYTRVWTPLDEHVLRVEDQDGVSLGVELLSSGTREQLFLALRLALASSFAERGIDLPLVLDDVLVNFDETRSKAAAMVLRDFAKKGHQVLIFTCHEHIARLFRYAKAEVRRLPDHTHGNAELPVPRPARRVAPAAVEELPAEAVPEAEPLAEEPVPLAEPVPEAVEVLEPIEGRWSPLPRRHRRRGWKCPRSSRRRGDVGDWCTRPSACGGRPRNSTASWPIACGAISGSTSRLRAKSLTIRKRPKRAGEFGAGRSESLRGRLRATRRRAVRPAAESCDPAGGCRGRCGAVRRRSRRPAAPLR